MNYSFQLYYVIIFSAADPFDCHKDPAPALGLNTKGDLNQTQVY